MGCQQVRGLSCLALEEVAPPQKTDCLIALVRPAGARLARLERSGGEPRQLRRGEGARPGWGVQRHSGIHPYQSFPQTGPAAQQQPCHPPAQCEFRYPDPGARRTVRIEKNLPHALRLRESGGDADGDKASASGGRVIIA